MKREQTHVARSLPKKPSEPKHIVCHHCGAFGHLRHQCSKFHAFKRIKRKEKLELFGSCAKKSKPILSENSILLNKMFNALNSLTICISGSYSSNPCLTSFETLIPNNHSVWMRNGSYGWAFAFLVLDLILSILYCFCFVWVKIQNHIKSEKLKKFDRICLSTYHMWVWPCTFILMA